MHKSNENGKIIVYYKSITNNKYSMTFEAKDVVFLITYVGKIDGIQIMYQIED